MHPENLNNIGGWEVAKVSEDLGEALDATALITPQLGARLDGEEFMVDVTLTVLEANRLAMYLMESRRDGVEL